MLIEPVRVVTDEAPYQPGFDTRSTALSTGTADSFRHFGLWQKMQQQATAIKHIHISDQGRFGAARLDCADLNVEALGYVVENPWMGRILNQHLSTLDNFTLRDECRVLSVSPTADGVEMNIENSDGHQEKIHTSLVVMAEGGRSGLAAALGIHREHKAYEQQAIIANVVTEKPHLNQAWERFTEKGPLALLPLERRDGKNRLALIWTHPAGKGDEVMQLPDADFLQLLQKDFGFRLGRFLKSILRTQIQRTLK
jgi:2-polyprenyl-6-methoxyphenol hydroxylase-like FAD-dependent oxidoreductase